MANITKRIGKNGALSYRIRAYAGTAADGRQIVRSMTFTPPAGMSARQAEKEAKRQAVEFEQRVQRGIVLDAKFTLDELLDKWFQEFARPQLKPQTVYGYQNLRVRISATAAAICSLVLIGLTSPDRRHGRRRCIWDGSGRTGCAPGRCGQS